MPSFFFRFFCTQNESSTFLPFQLLGQEVTLEKVFASSLMYQVRKLIKMSRTNLAPSRQGPRKHSKILSWWQVIFFFFRAVKKGIDVESGEFDQSLAENTFLAVVRNLLSRMRFLAIGVMLQLAAFTIIKLEFYVARNCCHNLTAFLALFPVWVLPLAAIAYFARPCWRSACFSIRNLFFFEVERISQYRYFLLIAKYFLQIR